MTVTDPNATDPTATDLTATESVATESVARRLQRDGYAIIPGLMSPRALAAARAELGVRLDSAEWGSGFDGTRTKRAWAPLAVTRCLDQAALASPVLDAVERAIGPGTQFSPAAFTTAPAPTSPPGRG